MHFSAAIFLVSIFISYAVSKEAHLVLLDDAKEAVCLDGSPPGFYYREGSGSDTTKFIIHLEKGGICEDEEDCLIRSRTDLGSSKNWKQTENFGGFLSDDETINKHFYNWNVVFVKYCDGGTYSGYKSKPVYVNGASIYFRGNKILKEIFQYLLNNQLKEATNVILTGCSAGGLATYIHADYVRSVLPSSVKYHAIADAGYLISMGNQLQKGEHKSYLYPFIKTPIFSLNSQYDTWQIENDLNLHCYPPQCNAEQMQKLQEFFQEFNLAKQKIINSPSNGAFLDSCFAHCQSIHNYGWNKVKVGGQSASETFANWYFGDSSGKYKAIDNNQYPSNESC